ncbi:MAG: hypothetical protein AMXMBFR33_07410 [Candidatus Xenobia bacterium]
MRERGQTLLETLVSLGLLSLLMVLMFAVYRTGANAWMKGDAQVSLIQDLRVVTERLAREVERSAYESATLDPGPNAGTALAFLSSWDEVAQRYDYDPAVGSPGWHKYFVCYYDAPAREVRWLEVALPTPTTTAAPLPGLASYRAGGRVLASQVDRQPAPDAAGNQSQALRQPGAREAGAGGGDLLPQLDFVALTVPRAAPPGAGRTTTTRLSG